MPRAARESTGNAPTLASFFLLLACFSSAPSPPPIVSSLHLSVCLSFFLSFRPRDFPRAWSRPAESNFLRFFRRKEDASDRGKKKKRIVFLSTAGGRWTWAFSYFIFGVVIAHAKKTRKKKKRYSHISRLSATNCNRGPSDIFLFNDRFEKRISSIDVARQSDKKYYE